MYSVVLLCDDVFVVVVLCGMAPGGYHIEQRENAANLGLEASTYGHSWRH